MSNSEEKTPQPVLIMGTVLAVLSSLTAATAFVEVVPNWVAGLLAAVTTALTIGLAFYTRGQVLPNALMAAYRPAGSSELLSGPAAAPQIVQGAPVSVTAATDTGESYRFPPPPPPGL